MNEYESKVYRAWAGTVAVGVFSFFGFMALDSSYNSYIQRQTEAAIQQSKHDVEIAAINAGLVQQPLFGGGIGWVRIDEKGQPVYSANPRPSNFIELDE